MNGWYSQIAYTSAWNMISEDWNLTEKSGNCDDKITSGVLDHKIL